MYNYPDPDLMPGEIFPTDLPNSSDPLSSIESDQKHSVTPPSTICHSSPNFPTDHHLAPNLFDGVGMEQPEISTLVAEPPQETSNSLVFRHYDPSNPQTCKTEKRHRDKTEIDQQREDVAVLKMFGGSCLWCIRTKKKCEAVSSCKACISHNRMCYRNISIFMRETSPINIGVPSQEARQILANMNRCAFQSSQQFDAAINIHMHRDFLWTWTVTTLNTTWPNSLDCPIEGLVDMIVGSQALNLIRFQHAHGNQPLVHSALNVAKLFTASQWLVQTGVLAHPAEMAGGQLVLLYVLVRCFHRLLETSADFCNELYYALRKPQPKAKAGLDPTWMAAALYYRVACGMRDLQNNSVVAKIFGPGCQIDGICKAMEKILWDVVPRHGVTDKVAKKKILRDEIPKLQTDTEVNMEFWQNRRPNHLQLIPSLKMEYFLFGEVFLPWDVPQGAATQLAKLQVTLSRSNYNEVMNEFELPEMAKMAKIANIVVEDEITYAGCMTQPHLIDSGNHSF